MSIIGVNQDGKTLTPKQSIWVFFFLLLPWIGLAALQIPFLNYIAHLVWDVVICGNIGTWLLLLTLWVFYRLLAAKEKAERTLEKERQKQAKPILDYWEKRDVYRRLYNELEQESKSQTK